MHTQYAFQLPSQPLVAFSSSLTSFSTPVDKAEFAEIQSLYLGNVSSGGPQIFQATSQPNMALLQCKILPTWAKALSSPIASFSTPNDKAECAKINKLYLGDALSVGLQILQASEPNMAILV